MTTARLGDILIRQGSIDAPKLDAALADQQAFGGKLGRTLVDLGYIDEEQLVTALAEQLGLATIDLATAELDPDAFSYLPVDTCERYGVLPVRVDKEQGLLWIATAEPDRKMLQEVAQVAQLTLEPMLAPMSAIDKAVRQYYYGEKTGPKQRLGEPMKSIPLDPGQTARPKAAAAAGPGVQQRAPQPAQHAAPQPQHAAAQPQAQHAAAHPQAQHAAAHPQAQHAAAQPQAQLHPPDAIEVDELSGIAPTPKSTDEVAELRMLLVRLEKTVAAQGRAFRGLVELLQDKGVVRRGELGSRTNKK